MFVIDGKYRKFIEKIPELKIFSEELKEENEFKSGSIDVIINCKKYKEEIDIFNNSLKDIKANDKDFNEKLKWSLKGNNFNEVNKYSNFPAIKTYKDKYDDLKSRMINILKIIKSSGVPFLLCYFPKKGDEFPFYLFQKKAIWIEKNIIEDEYYKYQATVKDLENDYISKTELNSKYLLKKDLDKQYVSKEDLDKNYISKKYLDKNYVSKEDLDKKYVSKEYLDKNYASKEYLEKNYASKKYLEKNYVSQKDFEDLKNKIKMLFQQNNIFIMFIFENQYSNFLKYH